MSKLKKCLYLINLLERKQTILEAIDKKRGIECDYNAFNQKTNKHQVIIPYFLRTPSLKVIRMSSLFMPSSGWIMSD